MGIIGDIFGNVYSKIGNSLEVLKFKLRPVKYSLKAVNIFSPDKVYTFFLCYTRTADGQFAGMLKNKICVKPVPLFYFVVLVGHVHPFANL